MFCPNCGKEMNDSAIFCSNCGWSKKSNVSKKGVFKIPKIPKVVLKSIIVVFGIVIFGLIIYNFPKPKGKVYELSDIGKAKSVSKYWKNSVVDNFDTVKFGSYAQSDASGNIKEPIEWIVLDRQGGETLLLSKYILDCKCYNNDQKDITWETCDLRKWLNSDFYNRAFSNEEQNRIQTTNVINSNNADHGTNGGNNTNDKVFCLSIDEAKYYFHQFNMKMDDKRLATRGTNYAKNVDNNGSKLYVLGGSSEWYDGNSYFWLRSPGNGRDNASGVNSYGYLYTLGYGVGNSLNGVRPALWVSY